MVHCIVFGCGSKSGKHRVSFHSVPKIVLNQGQEHEELTRERRTRWISAISRGDTTTKGILDSERVCGLHFVSGSAAAVWDKYNVDWVPTINLGKKKIVERSGKDDQKVAERAERAKERRKRTLERQEIEAAKKRMELDKTGLPVHEIDLSSDSAMDCASFEACDESCVTAEVENEKGTQTITKKMAEESTSTEDFELVFEGSRNTATQTEEFDYMFTRPVYRAPDKDFFDSVDKIRFYTGLPSYDVLMVVFDRVACRVNRNSTLTTLNSFQEFVMVLMKLRLNVPLQDLAYRFGVSVSSASRIFTSWLTAMDTTLSCFIYWPDRDELWKTMPMCFEYTFGKKVTVIIDCFEVFIEKPTNLLARAQTFSSYKHHNTTSRSSLVSHHKELYLLCPKLGEDEPPISI